jgi:hypothetical protein
MKGKTMLENNNTSRGEFTVLSVEDMPANNETATATALLAENAVLKSEVERLSKAFSNVREFVQASIDRDEWTETELQEIFWEELALMLGVDLKLTEEIEVTFTATYSAWVTVPKNTDITDLEIDLAWHPDVTLNGDGVGSANQDNVEVDPA